MKSESKIDFIDLIDFWQIQREQAGEPCTIMPFHETIADALTDLLTGSLDKENLLILMPPRCAKTSLCVRAFTPWSLSYFPDSEFIISGYSADLPTASTIEVRKTLSSTWYRSMIDSHWGARITMKGDKGGGLQDFFHTDRNGSVKAIGLGGGSLGFGAGKLREEFGGAVLLDDMMKAQDFRSAAMRRNVVDFYIGGLKSRRNRKEKPKTPIVLIMQRLHPDDLAGYILGNERDDWTIIQIPAVDESETATIWPGRLGLEELLEMKESRPDEYWSQYQQEPSESALTIFKKKWWKYWSNIEEVEKRITLKMITGDTAFKPKDSSDFSVLQCWGFDPYGGYLLDQDRGRWEFPDLLTHGKAFLKKHTTPLQNRTQCSEMWVEDKASGQSLVQTMRREGLAVRPWIPAEHNAADDKVGRANGCTPSISTGRIFLPSPNLPGYQWVNGFINEHFAFTADDSHLFDDQIDTSTMAILTWLKRGGGRGPIPPPMENPDSGVVR